MPSSASESNCLRQLAGQSAVSVVLPAYNRETLVRRAIESVLTQTFGDFELIVVDDTSTDDTYKVIETYSNDTRITICRNESNVGPGASRNRGIRMSKAPYVAFMDSDDRWLPEKLARQVEAIEQHPGCDVCYCGALYYAAEQCYYLPITGTMKSYAGDLSREILFGNPTTPQTLLVRRELLAKVGLFDETLEINEDWDLAIRLAQATEFAFVAEPLAIIYRTPNSVSSNRLKDAYFRERLLDKSRDLYSSCPSAKSRQYYIASGSFRRNGKYGSAVKTLLKSLYSRHQRRP